MAPTNDERPPGFHPRDLAKSWHINYANAPDKKTQEEKSKKEADAKARRELEDKLKAEVVSETQTSRNATQVDDETNPYSAVAWEIRRWAGNEAASRRPSSERGRGRGRGLVVATRTHVATRQTGRSIPVSQQPATPSQPIVREPADPTIVPARNIESGRPVPFTQSRQMAHARPHGRRANDSFLQKSAPTISDMELAVLKRYRQEPEGDRAAYSRGFLALGPAQTLPVAELDRLRKTMRCHIVLAPNDKYLSVFGPDKDTLETAMLGLREVLLRQIQLERPSAASKTDTTDSSNPGAVEPKPAKVLLVRVEERGRLTKSLAKSNHLINEARFEDEHVIITLGHNPEAPLPSHTEWTAWLKKLNHIQTGVFLHAVRHRIAQIKSTRDGVLMRARIGVNVFRNCMWEPKKAPDLPVKTFVAALEHDRTDAILSHLNHRPTLLQNTLQQDNLLCAKSSGFLRDVKPEYEILFELLPGAGVHTSRHLHVIGSYVNGMPATEKLWKEVTDRKRVGQILEVFMIRFDSGFSWKLQIDAAQPIFRPKDGDRAFATTVKLEPLGSDKRDGSSSRLHFSFQQNPGIRKISQKTVWRTALKANSSWSVDITKYEEFARSGSAWRLSSKPRWDVSVYHRRWIGDFTSAETAHGFPNGQIGRFLIPDDMELGEREAVMEFRRMMDQISDAVSLLAIEDTLVL